MELPSGRTLTESDQQLITDLNSVGFIRWNDKTFTLKSGIESHVYVFGREDITDHPLLLKAVGSKIVDTALKGYGAKNLNLPAPELGKNEPTDEYQQLAKERGWPEDVYRLPCLIGIPVAGTTMALAASVAGRSDGSIHIPSRMMRTEKKKHGAHHFWVDGRPDMLRHDYMTVDNVVTFGTSKFEAFDRLKEDGYPVTEMKHIIFIDRQQGALKRMENAGYKNVATVFNLLDLTYAYRELKLWPADAVKRVEDEIAAHQALPD